MADQPKKPETPKKPGGWTPPPEVPPTVKVLDEGTSRERVEESHPSYGLISVHRRNSGYVRLFGSPINHDQVVCLEIKRAVAHRNLASDWYHARDELIEIEMSEHQFNSIITSLNMGNGTPCTIRYVDGVDQGRCTQEHERVKLEREFKEKQHAIAAEFRKGLVEVQEILKKKSLTNADRQTIASTMDKCTKFMTDHAPFLASQFNEHMQHTVEAAQSEFSANIMAKSHALGLQGMIATLAAAGSGPPALEYKKPDTADGGDVQDAGGGSSKE